MRARFLPLAAAVAVLGAAVLSARATTLRRIPVGAAARRAPVILAGTVAGSSVRLAAAPGGATRIFTDYDFRDLATWKGDVPTANKVVSVVGGSLHGRTLGVEGTPRFEAGRRYLLLLDPDQPLCPVVGWTQGVFPLVPDAGGVLRVRLHDGRPVAGLSGGEVVPGPAAMSLEEFLAALDREGARATATTPAPGGGGREGPR